LPMVACYANKETQLKEAGAALDDCGVRSHCIFLLCRLPLILLLCDSVLLNCAVNIELDEPRVVA
jgi:hypothetical protein